MEYENDWRKWSTALLRERLRSKGDETNEPHEFLLHKLTATVTKEQPTQKSKLDILPRGKRPKPSNELAWLKISGPIFCSLAPWMFLLITAAFEKADRRDRALCVTGGHPRWIECQIYLGRGGRYKLRPPPPRYIRNQDGRPYGKRSSLIILLKTRGLWTV